MAQVEESAPTKGLPRWVVYVIAALTFAFVLGMSTWLLVGALHDRDDSQPIAGGVEVTGRVVDVDATSGRTWRAVIEFADRAGRKHTVTGPSGNERPEVGEPARVSYDPADPSRAHDLTFNHASWKWPFWTGIFCVAVAMLGAVTCGVVVVRQRRQPPADLAAPSLAPPLPTHSGTGLTRDQKGRLIGLWLPAAGFWIAAPFDGLGLATPIVVTAADAVMTILILQVARRRNADG
ncbi:MAG TPA: DUF3592 domain-containing protein [Marmoricola sp.]|jgi:hypothetical protein|nr:DUF3592 domain-containing protein [Marmoricola sp.]